MFNKIAGGLILLFGLGAIINSFCQNYTEGILWFCYFGLVLLGIGILIKSSFLIVSQLNILFIPLIVWSVDFFYYFLTRKPLLGITDYFFTNRNIFSQIISLQHILTIILVIGILPVKSKNAWKLSVFQIAAIYVLTRIFTSPGANINCVYRSCLSFTIEPYSLIWFIAFFLMIFLTNFFLNYDKGHGQNCAD